MRFFLCKFCFSICIFGTSDCQILQPCDCTDSGIYFFSKIVSLASITTFIIFPFATLLFFNWPEAIVALLMALISIVAHKANIRQLMVGTEQKTEIFNE